MGFGLLTKLRRYARHIMNERRAEQKISAVIRSGQSIKLEIGSGPVQGKNGWVTLDLESQADIYWDLLNGLPFPDDCISEIYSSHVMEHFYYRDLIKLLEECYRVIRPGGRINVCVPDASIYLKAYFDPAGFDQAFLAYQPAVMGTEGMDVVNYIAYMDGHHRHMFDQQHLLIMIARASFVDVQPRNFDPELDMTARKHESIYALGYKPK